MDEPFKPPLPAEACCNEQPSYMTPAGAMRPKGLADAGAETEIAHRQMDEWILAHMAPEDEFTRMFEGMEDDQVFLEKMRDEYERDDDATP
jgi:hypothetical protein